MEIRIATRADQGVVADVHRAAFPESERDLISQLAVDLLLEEETIPDIFSWVAESEGSAVGHVAFSPVTLEQGERIGFILAPLAVKPTHQNHGVGSALVERGIRDLSDRGPGLFFVYGDPTYYGRFGFSPETAESFIPPYDLQYPFGWQAMALGEETEDIEDAGRITCVPALSRPNLW